MSTRFGNKQEKYSAFTDSLQSIVHNLKKEPNFQPLVLFGANDFMLYKTAEYLFKMLVKSYPEASKVKMELGELSEPQFLDLFQQTSLFDEQQIYLIKRCDLKQKFEKFLGSLAATQVYDQQFIFTFGKAKLTKAIEKEMKRLHWQSLECVAPSSFKMPQYIYQAAKDKKLKLSQQACIYLHEMLGDNLTSIENELNRIALVIPIQNQEIDHNDIAKHCKFLREDDAFKISDAIIEGERAKVEALVFKLIQDGTQPLSILGVISRLLRTTALLQAQSTAGSVNLPPRIKDKYRAFGRKISDQRLAEGLAACQKADVLCKSSRNSSYLNIASVLAVIH